METNSVLNTIAATGADITFSARKLNVAITASTGSGKFPTLDYLNINKVTISPAITETLYSTRVGFTAANNTVYSFTVNQMVDGQLISKTATYTSDASGTNLEISTALAACFNGTALKVTVTGGNFAYVTVTALAGYPTFQVVLGATGTMTDTPQMTGVSIASCTVAKPSVCTANAHGLFNGSKITIVSADEARLASGTYIVQYLSANTFSLYTSIGEPLEGFIGTTTATVTKVASQAVGSGTVLAAAYAAGDANLSAAASGAGYAMYKFQYNVPLNGAPGMPSVNTGFTHTLWVKQWATTTSTAYTTNFAAFDNYVGATATAPSMKNVAFGHTGVDVKDADINTVGLVAIP